MKLLLYVFILLAVTAVPQAAPPDRTVFQIKNGTVVNHLEMGDEAPERVYFTFTGKDGLFATGYGSNMNQLFLGDYFLPGEQVSPSTFIDWTMKGNVSLSDTLTYEWVAFHDTRVQIEGDPVTLPTEPGLSPLKLSTHVRFDGEIRGCPVDLQIDPWGDQCIEQPYVPFVLKVHKEGKAIMEFVWSEDHYIGIRAAYFIDPDKKDPVVPW